MTDERTGRRRDGNELSVGEGEALWSDRELRVAVERARAEGWNAALDGLDGARKRRGGGLGGLGGGGRGIGEGDDLRRLVGERFATALEGIYVASLRYLRGTVGSDGGGLGGAGDRATVKPANGLTDRPLRMPGAKRAAGVKSSVGGMVVDERALAFKGEVDRKIRKLTREMERWLENESSSREEKVVRKCGKCKKYAEDSWKFCPRDGQKLE